MMKREKTLKNVRRKVRLLMWLIKMIVRKSWAMNLGQRNILPLKLIKLKKNWLKMTNHLSRSKNFPV